MPSSARAAFAVVAAIYVLAFPYHPGLRSPNELCRLWQARSVVEYGQLEINQALRDYGWVGDLSVKDGRYYPSKAPLLSFAAVPIYAALRAWGGGYKYAIPPSQLPFVFFARLFLTVLPTLWMLVLLRRFLRAYASPAVADGVAITYALGSLAFSYSLLFMSHQPSAVLGFAGLYALWRLGRGEWRERGYLLAGAAAGAAIMAEYTSALMLLGLLIFGALSALERSFGAPAAARWIALGRSLALATLGALPFVAALGAYHWAAFGGPLVSGYRYLADPGYQPWHLGGFLGIRTPDPRAFFLSFFSPLRGLLALSPFLALAAPGMWLLWRDRGQRPLFWSTLAVILAYAYFTSSFSYESWGWTTGPRHLTGLVPFLLVPVALAVERARERSPIALGIAAGLCAASIVVTGALSLVDYVPDSVTNAFYGLAVPLFRDGFLPPSLLAMAFPNPSGGALLLAALGAGAVLAALLLARGWKPIAWAAAAAAAFLLALSAFGGDTPQDLGAQRHLESVWLTPPGVELRFWPRQLPLVQ